MLGSGGLEGGDPNGESNGPLHRDDSTFGEYMAALDGRSSSGNGVRRLNSSGTSSRGARAIIPYVFSDSQCIAKLKQTAMLLDCYNNNPGSYNHNNSNDSNAW